MSKSPVLFLHGGPGLSSHHERKILEAPLLASGFKPHFWNEPSRQRWPTDDTWPGYSFQAWQKSAIDFFLAHSSETEPAILIAHSFAAAVALRLAADHPTRVRALLLITPGTQLDDCLRRICKLAEEDFRENGQTEKADQIESLLLAPGRPYTETLEPALLLALQDSSLYSHYWRKHEHLTSWAISLGEAPFTPDADSFVMVLRTYDSPLNGVQHTVPAHIPCLAVFGWDDRVVNPSTEMAGILRLAPHAVDETIPRLRHYWHIEEPTRLVSALERLAESSRVLVRTGLRAGKDLPAASASAIAQ